MFSESEAESILSEISSLLDDTPSFCTSFPSAYFELTAILDAYDGDLPTSHARDRYHSDNMEVRKNAAALERSGAYLQIWYPMPYAKLSGEATWTVSAALLLRLIAEQGDCEPNKRARYLRSAEYFAAMEALPPPHGRYEEFDKEMADAEASDAEMLAIIHAVPDQPHRHAEAHVNLMMRWNKDAREGYDYNPLITIDYPDGPHDDPNTAIFLVTPVGYAMHLVASHVEPDDFSQATKLRDMADRFYLDRELQVEVALPTGDCFGLFDFEFLGSDDAGQLVADAQTEHLPGSLSIRHYTAKSRYSEDPGELPYRLFRYWHEEGDDRIELCLLVSTSMAYSAYVGRD